MAPNSWSEAMRVDGKPRARPHLGQETEQIGQWSRRFIAVVRLLVNLSVRCTDQLDPPCMADALLSARIDARQPREQTTPLRIEACSSYRLSLNGEFYFGSGINFKDRH